MNAQRLAWFTAAYFLTSVIAAAQVRVVRYNDDRLTGIRSVDVFLTTADPIDSPCALRRQALQESAVKLLRAGGVAATLSERSRSTPYSVVISVRSAAVASHCASSVMTELVAEIRGVPEADRFNPPGTWGSLLVGTMPLARQDGLVTTTVEEHDAAVQRTVSDQVAAIAERVRRANP